MARIRCHYVGCIHLEDGYCGLSLVEFDPEEGCRIFTQSNNQFDEDWVDEEEDELSDWDEEDLDDWYADEDEEDDFSVDLDDDYD